jgi:hypothetical protein
VQADYAKPLAETQTGRVSETSALTERWSQSPRAIGFHSGPRPFGGVLGGRSPVGITSTGGSAQNEAHLGKTAGMTGDDGRAIEGPGQPITAMPGKCKTPVLASAWRAGSTLPLTAVSTEGSNTPGQAQRYRLHGNRKSA